MGHFQNNTNEPQKSDNSALLSNISLSNTCMTHDLHLTSVQLLHAAVHSAGSSRMQKCSPVMVTHNQSHENRHTALGAVPILEELYVYA